MSLQPGVPLHVREALAAHGVEADHVKVWQTVGKLRRRHGLVMSGSHENLAIGSMTGLGWPAG